MYSDAYVECLSRGPFPGRIDPWAEAGRYFHPIHGSMISDLLSQMRAELLRRGYFASREVSLQVTERLQPNVQVRGTPDIDAPLHTWDYAAAASAVALEPGVVVSGDMPDLEAIYIKEFGSDNLVTVVEIISPSNKDDRNEMDVYIQRRDRLIKREHVNFVEIDATRSVKRLLRDVLVTNAAYHIAIYVPGDLPRVLTSDYGQPLKPFALPLRNEVLPIDTQLAYDNAYQEVTSATNISASNGYQEADLPFPSLLTPNQRVNALQSVHEWKTELTRLSHEKP